MRKVTRQFALSMVGLVVALSASAQSLSSAVQFAINNNPDVIYAVNQRYAADEGIVQARSDYFPILHFGAGKGLEYAQNPVASALTDTTNSDLTRTEASAEATEHLFTGHLVSSEVARNQYASKADAFKISGIANDIALEVTQQYLNVLMYQRLVAVAQSNLSENQQISSMISKRTEAGIDKSADSSQASGRVDLAQSNLISEQSFLDDAEAKFIRVVGTEPVNLTQPTVPAYPVLPSSYKQILGLALQNHPTILSAQADIQEAIAQHVSSKNTDYPHLDFVLADNHDDNIDGIPGYQVNKLAIFRATYDLNLGGKDFAKQRQTAYQVQEAIQVRDRALMELEESTQLSWNALVNAQDRLAYLKGHMQDSLATLNAYEEQFKLSKRSLLDLLDQQNEYYQSEIDYIQGQYTEKFARFRLLNDIGTLTNYLHAQLPQAAMPGDVRAS